MPIMDEKLLVVTLAQLMKAVAGHAKTLAVVK